MDVHVGSFSNPEGIEGLAHFLGLDPYRKSVVEICIRFICLFVCSCFATWSISRLLFPFRPQFPLEQEWYLERLFS